MAKIKNPIRFSHHFDIDEDLLTRLGVLNPTLNADTKLFIDPFLISESKHPELSKGAIKTYENHFATVIKLLAGSKYQDDAPWRGARRLMEFPELKYTCLGYGASSVSGSGSGVFTTASVMRTAKEIVELGINDPDLFAAMALLEEGIGPDRISDMTTNVIFPDLLAFNARVLKALKVPLKLVELNLKNGKTYVAELPINPFVKDETPIVLVPADILRDLPIVTDWSEISDAASRNAALRAKVNKHIAEIWRRKTRRDKSELRRWAMKDRNSFEIYLELLKSTEQKPYDLVGDPMGETAWLRILENIANELPFVLADPQKPDADSISAVVTKIIEQFQFLIEKRRLSEDLYHNGKPRPEKAAQRLFFAVAYAYCKANNLDLTPEADTSNGPVDFKVSSGFTGRILVEIKLSTNAKVVTGYTKQLATYMSAEETTRGHYIVIDVGQMGKKIEQLLQLKKERALLGHKTPEIFLIDGLRRISASKL